MLPIALASVAGMGIAIERAWSLSTARVAPFGLGDAWRRRLEDGSGDYEQLRAESESTGLGRILFAGLANAGRGRTLMKEAMETTAAAVVHDLERYLTALGTVASVSPLLGLLGTVVGMIRVFRVLVSEGTGNVAMLAGGIAEALVTTAAGLTVAIPALVFHRYLLRKVDDLVVRMEGEAERLLDAIHPQAVQA